MSPGHFVHVSGLTEPKRKLSRQLHHDQQSLQMPPSSQGLIYPAVSAVPGPWPLQSLSNDQLCSEPAHFCQPSPWDESTPTSWQPLHRQSSHASVPSLTDGSGTTGNSPSSQQDAVILSDLRSAPLSSADRSPPEWTPTHHHPIMSSYSSNHQHQQHQHPHPHPHQHHQHGHFYQNEYQPTLAPSDYFTSGDCNQHRPLAAPFQPWQPSIQQLPVAQPDTDAWGCQTYVPCVDPTCMDGIPCDAALMPPCDRPDCQDDGIPCEQPHLSGSSEPLCEQAAACTTPDDTTGGYCCSDECPPETRCPSPCFEEDCQLPPCDVEHDWAAADWALDNHVCLSARQQGCVDPRHTFHNHDHLPVTENPFQQHLNCLHEAHQPPTVPPANHELNEWASTPHTAKRKTQVLHTCQKVPKHHHGLCSHRDTHNHHLTSGATSLDKNDNSEQFVCKWVHSGDPEDADAVICGAQYVNAEDMQVHMNDHVNEQERDPETGLFPCLWKGCSHHRGCQGFQARPKLKRHTMTHTGAAPWQCNECGRMMRTKDALDKHKRTHSGQKPFICNSPGCCSRFATSTELKTHLTVHSGKKPHKCPICGEPFADSSNLSKHKKTHERGKFHCPDCTIEMKRWDQMRRHFMSQKHGLQILESKEAEKDYKLQMDEAFNLLTPEERQLDPSKTRERSVRGRGGRASRQSSSFSQLTLADMAM